MRVLHLIDPASPGGGACTLFLLAEAMHRLNSVDQRVLILGNRRRTDLARRCGVAVSGQLNVPLGLPMLARVQLKTWRDAAERLGFIPDIVHAWTPYSALLAASVISKSKLLGTFTVGPTPGLAVSLLASRRRRRPFPIIATSAGVFQECAALGIDSEHLSVLPPAVNPKSVHMTPRKVLRRRWHIDNDTFVVGLLADPWSWSDAHNATDILARLASAGRRIRLLVHHRAFRRVHAERWVAALGWPDFIITDDEVAEPWKIVNGLDAALFVGSDMNVPRLRPSRAILPARDRRRSPRPMPGTMPLLWAMAAGVPVVAEMSPAVIDVVRDGRNGLLVSRGDLVTAADRMLRLHDDRSLARRIGGAALDTVNESFDISAYAVRLRDTYEHVVQDLSPYVLGVDQRPWAARRDSETESWTMR